VVYFVGIFAMMEEEDEEEAVAYETEEAGRAAQKQAESAID
jgi:hypothetical protein